MKNLDQKDISFLSSVVSTHSEQEKLNAYTEAQGKAVEAYKGFIDEVLANKEADKQDNETIHTKQHKIKHHFKVGDKVRFTDYSESYLPNLFRLFGKYTIFTIVEMTNSEEGPYPSRIKDETNNTIESRSVIFKSNYDGEIYSFFEKVSEPKSSTTESNVNKKRKQVIHNALKYIDKKYYDLSLSGLEASDSAVITQSSRIINLQIKDINSGITLRESKAVCPNKYVFNRYIGIAIALSKLLNDKKAYTYFSNAPQPTIACDQYAILDDKLARSKYLEATYVFPAEDSDYVMLYDVKIKKGISLEGICRIISDDIAIY